MKYKELVKLIENISLHIPNINSFYIGDVYEINSDPTVKYSTVVLTNQESTFSMVNEQYTYNFVLFYIDRLSDDEKNRLDIQSHAIDALSNILEVLGNSYNCIIDNYRFEVFKERFADLCSGAFARVSVVVDEMDCIESFKIISENDLKSIAINRNGEYHGLYNKVIVDVPAPYYRTKHLEVTENNKLYVASDEGLDGYESVNVNVPEPSIEENRIVIEPANGTYKITPTDGHDAMKEVSLTVAVPNPALTNLNVTENGTYEAVDSGYYGFASVSVDVPQPTYNSGELVAKENGVYRASDNGYDGYYAVIVDVPQSGGGKWVMPDKTSFNGSPMKTFDANGVDATNLTTMYYMFAGCDGLTELDLSSWDTSNVKYMERTFYDCGFLSKLNVNFNTSSVTTMQYTFSMLPRLASIDLSTWDTSKVWDMSYMFYESSKLNAINGITNWNTSAVTTTAQMFAYCGSNLSLNLSGWNVLKVTDFNHMFFYSGIVSVNISNWRFKDSANVNSMFGYCGSLTTIITNENTVLPDVERLSLGLEDNCPNVTAESFANLFRALPISTHNGTFTIGSTNLSKLSDAQKAIATSKGWTLA